MADAPIAVVTGGAGFIGSHVVDVLVARGHSVRVVDNFIGGREANLEHHRNDPRLTVDTVDVRQISPQSTIFKDASLVFHLAGIGDIVPSIEHPAEYMSVNVQGTIAVLEASRHAGSIKGLAYAASSSCYGLADVPTAESHPIDPRYPYALSKYLGECAVMHWESVYRLPANSIRIFNAYGTRSRTSGAYGAVFGVFLRQKLAGAPFTVVGDGSQRRDFVYATDVADAFYRAANADHFGRAYNVGAGNPQSVNRLIELLGGDRVTLPRRPGEPDCTWADISLIGKELGWSPKVDFEHGVRQIIENIEYWRDAPLWTPESIDVATRSWFSALQDTQ